METKKCTKCGIEYPKTKEYFNMRNQGRYFTSRCKKCLNSQYNEWYESNPEWKKEYNKVWEKENSEHRKILYAKWQRLNRENRNEYQNKLRQLNLEWYRERAKSYYDNNKETIMYNQRAGCANTRAKQYKLQQKITIKDIKLIYEKQEAKCYYCNKELEKNFSLDHIIPYCKGGENIIENIGLTCMKCNLKKQKYSENEYIELLNKFGKPENIERKIIREPYQKKL